MTARQTQAIAADHRAENAAFLLAMGEHPEHIAARLGVTLAGLARPLRRRGELGAARAFEAAILQRRAWRRRPQP